MWRIFYKGTGSAFTLKKLSNYFGLKFAHVVFGATEQLLLTLQYKELNVQEASLAVRAAFPLLERQRSHDIFDLCQGG